MICRIAPSGLGDEQAGSNRPSLDRRAEKKDEAIMSEMIVQDFEWKSQKQLVDYADALVTMQARAQAIAEGKARELVWLLEHPPLYTAGTSADPAELLNPQFPVHSAGRGGRYTYHGPGQRVGYVLANLDRRGRDVRNFVHSLEGWMIDSLADLGITARREPGRIGIWTGQGLTEAKIGAIGVRVRRWITLHGFSINVAPDLTHFGGIVPCGLADFSVTSVKQLGFGSDMAALDSAILANFPNFVSALGSCNKKT
jgi:lipoyl(octanoyl) transferase